MPAVGGPIERIASLVDPPPKNRPVEIQPGWEIIQRRPGLAAPHRNPPHEASNIQWGSFKGIAARQLLGTVLEVIHSLRFTTVKILHPAYDTIDAINRPSEKNETYCWVNVWSCYNRADVEFGVLFCFPWEVGFLLDDELDETEPDDKLDTARRDERAITMPEVPAKAMPPRSQSQPAAGRLQGPEEFNLSSGRGTELGDSIESGRSQGPIFPDGHRPEAGPARPKKVLPQKKAVPPKAAMRVLGRPKGVAVRRTLLRKHVHLRVLQSVSTQP